jgi:hypothetical protein
MIIRSINCKHNYRLVVIVFTFIIVFGSIAGITAKSWPQDSRLSIYRRIQENSLRNDVLSLTLSEIQIEPLPEEDSIIYESHQIRLPTSWQPEWTISTIDEQPYILLSSHQDIKVYIFKPVPVEDASLKTLNNGRVIVGVSFTEEEISAYVKRLSSDYWTEIINSARTTPLENEKDILKMSPSEYDAYIYKLCMKLGEYEATEGLSFFNSSTVRGVVNYGKNMNRGIAGIRIISPSNTHVQHITIVTPTKKQIHDFTEEFIASYRVIPGIVPAVPIQGTEHHQDEVNAPPLEELENDDSSNGAYQENDPEE